MLSFFFVGGALLFSGAGFKGWLTELSQTQLEVILGENVEVTSAEIHATELSLDLVGVEVISDQGVLFRAERIRADSSITGGQPSLEFVRPVGEVWIVDGLLRDFPGLGWAARDESKGLPFGEISIVDGDIEVIIVQQGVERRVHLSGISLDTDDLSGDLDFSEVVLQLPTRAPIDLSAVDFGLISLSDEAISLSGFNYESQNLRVEGNLGHAPGDGLFGDVELSVSPSILDSRTKDTWTFLGDINYSGSITGGMSSPVIDGLVTGSLEWTYGMKRVPKVFAFENLSGAVSLSPEDGLVLTDVAGDYGGGELSVSGVFTKELEVHGLSLDVTESQFDLIIGDMVGHPEPWVDFDGDSTIVVSGTLRPFDLSGEISIDATNANAWNRPERTPESLYLSFPHLTAVGTITAQPGNLELNFSHVRSPSSDVAIRTHSKFGPRGSTEVFFSTESLYLPDLTPLGGLELQGYGAVEGYFKNAKWHDPEFSADVDFVDFGAIGYQFMDSVSAHIGAINFSPLSIDNIRGNVGDSEFTGRLRYEFSSDEPLAVDFSTVAGRIEDFLPHFTPVDGVEGELFMSMHLEGAPSALTGRFDATMSDMSLWGEQYTVGEANGTMDQGDFSLAKLLIQKEEGSSSIMARGRVTEGGELNGELLIDALAIPEDLFDGDFVDGTLQVDAMIGGSFTSPEPSGRISWLDATIRGNPSGDGEVRFNSDDGLVDVEGALLGGGLEMRGSLSLINERAFRLEAGGESLPLGLLLSESINGDPIRGEFSGGFNARGTLGVGFEEVSAYVDSGGLRWRDRSLSTEGRWGYKSGNNSSMFHGVHLVGEGVDVTLSGVSIDGDSWAVDGGGMVDLSWLPMVAPTVEVAHGNGELTIRSDPDLEVALNINNGTLRMDWFPHSMNDIVGSVTADGSGVQLESIVGSIGGGAVTISGGLMSRDWSPHLVGIDLGLTGSSVKLFESLPTLTGNGDLELSGAWPFSGNEPLESDLLLSGDVELTDVLFTERIDWEEWLLDFRRYVDLEQVAVSEEAGLLSYNISVAGEGAGRLRNNIAEGVCDVDLVVVGDTTSPGLTGVVRMHPGGSVVLQDREFELVRGELRYIDPFSFDPELNLLMRTEVESRDESYRIEYHIDGPLTDWYSSAVSTPSLSQADINALLLFGLTRDDLERFGGVNSALLMEGADILLHGIGLDNRALDTIGGGVALFDRVELVTGASERGNQVASETRVMLEKRLEAPYSTDMRFEFNPLRTAENTLELEREVSDGIYVTIFRSSMEQDRSLEIGGAYGVDFKMRWDVE